MADRAAASGTGRESSRANRPRTPGSRESGLLREERDRDKETERSETEKREARQRREERGERRESDELIDR
jgi:hypothetical protein